MWSQWYLIEEKNSEALWIRRYRKADGKTKHERYPAKLYKHLSKAEAEALVRRLNVTREMEKQQAEKRYDFDHAFINEKVKEAFSERLWQDITEPGHHTSLLTFLNKYILEYFVLQLNLPDPKAWKEHETAFGVYLLKTRKLSVSSTRQIIQLANRFLAFLHESYRSEVPEITLRPLGRRKVKYLRAEEIQADTRKKYISQELFSELIKKIDPSIRPHVEIGFKFGLRAAETMGLSEDDIFENELDVKRQLKRCPDGNPKFSPLKSREERSVPYWFSSPAEAHKLIKEIKFMHPKTLSTLFSEEMARLGHSFQFHDLRRSFVTRALAAGQTVIDVKDACGHADVKTTMRYRQAVEKAERRKFQHGRDSEGNERVAV